MIPLRHNRIVLALHELRGKGDGRPLLHLHGLGERSPAAVPGYLDAWPGPVYALDFTGHGASTRPRGGGYTAEVLMADADTALRHVGEGTVFGRGLGAYVALLVAGARPDAVRGAILFDGPGILGGGPDPGNGYVTRVHAPTADPQPDPFALAELALDVRPPDYAANFVRLAVAGSVLEHPVAVSAVNRPPWLTAVVAEAGVIEAPLPEVLTRYAAM
ncbi:MAG: alpha/beta fold hydrolase [Acidimicrobiales bacterium]